jgi:hypothetical protein
VVSHFGRGKLSTYCLLVEEEAPPAAQQRPSKSGLERWIIQSTPNHRTAISLRMRDLQRIS